MGSAPAPVVSGPTQAELDQRERQFSVTTQLQREAQQQQMALQQKQFDLQKAAQDRQAAAQLTEAQTAANASRRSTLLERANAAAAANEASLMGAFQGDQAALTSNATNTAKEKQRKTDATTQASRANLISQLTRTRSLS